MLLELQHVIKRFHDKELLHIPVWQIHQGQLIGLIGANGCGKTTLLRILQGVCGVEEGVVRRFCTLSYFEQLSQQVSYGDGRLLRELSVSHLKQVSGGEQQRLRLSKALSTPLSSISSGRADKQSGSAGNCLCEKSPAEYGFLCTGYA